MNGVFHGAFIHKRNADIDGRTLVQRINTGAGMIFIYADNAREAYKLYLLKYEAVGVNGGLRLIVRGQTVVAVKIECGQLLQ